jgi:hypothetical protein
MRATPAKFAFGVAATLAATLVLPAAAQAAPARAAAPAVPTYISPYYAGYEQDGCLPGTIYREIQGTIIVPAATDVNGTPGISSDIYSLGGVNSGVNAGVAVDNSNHQAFYFAFGYWDGQPVTAFDPHPGDRLEVTIENEGSAGYMVELFDENTGQEWAQTAPDPNANLCQAAAYELSPYPAYPYTTRTTPISFDFSRVWWQEQGHFGVTKLLGLPPANASLFRYNLIDSSGATVAVTSRPSYGDNNFTIFDI